MQFIRLGVIIIYQKECSICKQTKELDDFYSYEKVNSKGEKYIYHNPECKECTRKKSKKWQKENIEKRRSIKIKYHAKPESKEMSRVRNKQWREKGKQREWYANNPDLLKLYGKTRSNKKHEISKKEWESCKEYFNHSCAYCGLSLQEHKQLYKQDLHREHVNAEGSNKLDNCVPACHPCNSSKGTYELEEWYSEGNEIFDKHKLDRIKDWLEKDYKNFIEIKE